MKKLLILSFVAISMLLGSCSKEYLVTTPTSSVSSSAVFQDLNGMEMAMQGVYRNYGQWRGDNGFTGMMTIDMFMRDMMAGTIARPNTSNGWYSGIYNFSNFSANTSNYFYYPWRFMYINIKNINFILTEGAKIEVTSPSDEAIKQHILGEAYIARAWAYLCFGQLFGGRWPEAQNEGCVPVVTDPYAIDPAGRNTLARVFQQVQSDLTAGTAILEVSTYDAPFQVAETQRFTKYAAYLLQARLSLYTQDYATALAYAKKVTADFDVMSMNDYSTGFNSVSNPDYIFSVYNDDSNPVYFGSFYAYMSSNYSSTFSRTGPNALSSDVLRKVPATDVRRALYVTDNKATIDANIESDKYYYYNQGFGPTSSSYMMEGASQKYLTSTPGSTLGGGDVPYMRAAEAYYIAAEAAVLNGDLAGGAAILASIVTPYNPAYTAAATTAQFNEDLYIYKSFDMYGEGSTWADIKRRGDTVIRTSVSDGGNHMDDAIVFEYSVTTKPEIFIMPLPKTALEQNSELPNVVQ